VQTSGEPFSVSICHCLPCQRRTGSAFGMQAGFRHGQVEVRGRYSDYSRTSTEPDRKEHIFHFCPECGSTVFYTEPTEPDLVAVAVGAFADPSFPPPTRSGYGNRRHSWVVLPEGIVHDELWAQFSELYLAGAYAEVADGARPVIAANPGDAQLLYNVACCESLAGRAEDAIAHLGRAIAIAPEQMRELAAEDADLDPIRKLPAFRGLVAVG
jgi:hypothetical protein